MLCFGVKERERVKKSWLDDAFFLLVFPLHLVLVLLRQQSVEFNKDLKNSTEALFAPSPGTGTSGTTHRLYRKLWLRVFFFSIPFTAATYCWVSAFYLTTAARLVAVCSSSVCFTYLFEIILLGERFKFKKLLAVALGMCGVVVICGFFWSWLGSPRAPTPNSTPNNAANGNSSDKGKWLGDVYALASAILTALSEVLYKKYFVPKQQAVSLPLTNLVTTMIGAVTVCVLWIAVPILHVTKVEPFALPDPAILWVILLDAFFYVAFFTCSFISVAVTGPVWTSVGTLFFTPVVATVDWLVYRRTPSWSLGVGALMITGSFFLLINDDFEFGGDSQVSEEEVTEGGGEVKEEK